MRRLLTAALGAAAALAAAPTALALPDDRAYELVSPPDKNGGNILAATSSAAIAERGGRVMYQSKTGFARSSTSGPLGIFFYVAHRGADGWVTPRGLLPTSPPDFPAIFAANALRGLSADLSTAALDVYRPDLPGGLPDAFNIVRRDTVNGSMEVASKPATPIAASQFNSLVGAYQAASADLSHIAFEAEENFTPDATGSATKVWEAHDGAVRPVSILPGGTTPVEAELRHPGISGVSQWPRDMVSDDGSRIFFRSSAGGGTEQIYMRRDGVETVWVSEPEATATPTPADAYVHSISQDGRRVVFETTAALVDEDTDTSEDIYMYVDSPDPATDSNLHLMSVDEEPADGSEHQVAGALGVADGANRAYFVVRGQLVEGEPAPLQLHPRIYLWDDGELTSVAQLVNQNTRNWEGRSDRKTSRVSEDGRYLLFSSDPDGGLDAEHRHFYLYDAADDSTVCVSCRPDGLPTTSDANIAEGPGETSTTSTFLQFSHALSDDGRYVFFDTGDPLVAEDTNGTRDVYAYDTASGTAELISSGRLKGDAMFMDASADGSEVLFNTRAALVGWDTDSVRDVYVAKVGGGFPEPPAEPEPCRGAACQGPVPAVPAAPSPASERLRAEIGDGRSGRPVRGRLHAGFGGKRQALALARRSGRLRVVVRASRATRVRAVVRMPVRGRVRTVGRGARRVSRAGRAVIGVRLAAVARRRLRSRRPVRLRVVVRGRNVGERASRSLRLRKRSVSGPRQVHRR